MTVDFRLYLRCQSNLQYTFYRVVQKKVYDRVCSLKKLIYRLFCDILFFRQFLFSKHVFKINRKKVIVK